MTLIINVIDDVIAGMREQQGYAPAVLNSMFPEGEVYVRAFEFKGHQWRVLQRGELRSYFNTCLPIEVHQLPECVQVVHLCAE